MPEHERAPERFLGDRYHVVRELGRGGMGVVYLARDGRLDMDVAVKVRAVEHADATLWIKREFRAVSSLRHPNLVELYELVAVSFAHDCSCYFTMEYLPGIDPRRFVLRAGDPALSHHRTRTVPPLHEANTEPTEAVISHASPEAAPPRPLPAIDFALARSVLGQLAEGLAYLHAHGVIHRDIKPSNALVVDGTVKLLDFGLALERRRQDGDLSREGRVVGTAAYLAPEYLERLVVSPAMDIYALGVLGFELITGAPPFGGALGFLPRFDKRPAMPRAAALNPETPPELDGLLARMLAPVPEARPTALEIATILSGTSSHHRAPRTRETFVGRADELAQLAARIADPDPRGRLTLVAGPSGVGKTALVEEACRAAGNLLTWRGRCHERERVPYRAFDAIIDDIATQLAFEPSLITTVEHGGALARVFPALGQLIGTSIGTSTVAPATDLRVERERALIAMAHLFGALVPRGIIAIDDLQWADEDSLDLLAILVERVERPLTIIASWTTDEPPRAMRALFERLGKSAQLIDLPAMPERDLASLIHSLAPNAPTFRLLAAARVASGSPYLAELIGRELAQTDLSQPPTPHLAEARRLERLDPAERTVADIAALATGAITFQQLRDLGELPAGRLASALRGLEDARVLRAMPSAAGDPVYAFYHQRLRDAAHDAMPVPTRRAGHAAFAHWYETSNGTPESLAYHWEHANEPARAARWAIAAGDAAFAQLAWTVAAGWYRRALVLEERATSVTPVAPAFAPRIDPDHHARTDQLIRAHLGERLDERPLRAKLGEALFLSGDLADATEHFLAVAAGATTTAAGDHWRVRAAEGLLKLGEIERALAILDGVLETRGEHRAKSRRQSVVRAFAIGLRWLAPLPRRPTAGDPILASVYRVIASYLSTPYPIEALEYVLRGVALAERSGDAAAHGQGLAMLAAYLATGTLGRFGDRALARAERLADAATARAGYPGMVIAGSKGILRTLRGDWAGMREAHAAGERICKQLGLERSWEASFLRSYWATGELYAGDASRSLALLDDLTSDDLFTRALLGSYRGRALVLANDLAAARSVARKLDRSPEARRGVAAIYRGVFATELALADHDWPLAAQLAAELAEEARTQWLSTMPAISAMIDVVSATADLGLARAGDRGAASRALATARRLHRRGRYSFYAATSLRLQAQAQQLLGDDAWRSTLSRAASTSGGGEVDRLAIAALAGSSPQLGVLANAVAWSTGGAIAAS